jgi:hypothetical protein
MNKLSTTLPTQMAGFRGLILVLTATKARAEITELIAALVLRSSLFVVAANDWLPAYDLTRILRNRTPDVRHVTARLRTARASTCYRLLDILENLPPAGEPILVLDFLETFYDQDVPLRVRFHKVRACGRQLERLALYRPVILMTRQTPTEDYESFSPVLRSIADRTLYIEPEVAQVSQPALF